jgi:hypothetical protein
MNFIHAEKLGSETNGLISIERLAGEITTEKTLRLSECTVQ